MSVNKYATTPSGNTLVGDGSGAVGIQEGMPRGAVNDAIRAMASDLAKLYKDQGSLVTTGTSAAFNVAANSAFSSYNSGMMLSVKFHADCNAGATININALGAKQLRMRGNAGLTNVEAGAIKSGEIHHIIYDGSAFTCIGLVDYVTIKSAISTLQGYFSGGVANDAAKLGGVLPANYARTDANETFEGTVQSFGDIYIGGATAANTNPALYAWDQTAASWRYLQLETATQQWKLSDASGTGQVVATWNDSGAGKGWNADLLDGLHASSFMRSDQWNTIAYPININLPGEALRIGYGSAVGSDPYIGFYNGMTRLGYLQFFDTGAARLRNDSAGVNLDILSDGQTLSFNGGSVIYSGPAQTVVGAKTFSSALTASVSVTSPRHYGSEVDTLSAPSFCWGGANSNTGLYLAATDTIGFVSNGVERGRINTTGFSGNGSQLTSLNASNLGSGTVPNARLAPVWSTIETAVAGMTYGGVGSLVFARYQGADIDQGSTVAGSALTPTNAAGTGGGPALSGTWRALGNPWPATVTEQSTLFVRIS